MIRPLRSFDATRLCISQQNKQMLVDISEVGQFQNIYTDTAEVGVALFNPRTGVFTVWMVSETRYNIEELQDWILVPIPETVARYPHLSDWTLRVFND